MSDTATLTRNALAAMVRENNSLKAERDALAKENERLRAMIATADTAEHAVPVDDEGKEK